MDSSSIAIQQSIPLAPYTTFRIGGPARYFAEITSEPALLEAIAFAREHNLPIFVLGGGSNLLVSDSGFDGLVLHVALQSPIAPSRSGSHINCTVAAGVEWNAFVLAICEQGISGIECLAGIPGSVGGTPVQNVGAYGQEVAETILSVRALDLTTNTFVDLPNAQCGFAYRLSIFNSSHRNRYIVTAVTFRFDAAAKPRLTYADLTRHFGNAQPTPIEVYHAVREIRHRKGMLLVEGESDCRGAGSFFKNPVVPQSTLTCIATTLNIAPEKIPHWPTSDGHIKLPAAWLLEHAGFPKGFTLGNAGISSRHTLALINRGNATAADIATLRDTIRTQVSQRFGITLEQEPVQVGQ
ncbi:UDP-N-acetylmuramate dehydrogenase [Edaphobacter bradus]|uniref:UDP-N-acetylmuramate dehydrogenase n=1 Tax=Edaphobacter bradus TaxID=2259016 RepID=UPI00295C32F5|nr:UDP-N-acetylmuramate dehydrogenase [Edaphobacter bradus]